MITIEQTPEGMATLVANRLRETTLKNPFLIVETISDLEALPWPPPMAPACYVFPAGWQAETGTMANDLRQRVQVKVGVVFVVAALQDRKGGAAVAALPTPALAVINALFGWVPVENAEPFEAVEGTAPLSDSGFVGARHFFQTTLDWRL